MYYSPSRTGGHSLVEPLEDRRLMAVSIELAEGVLNIRGDADVANNVRVSVRRRAGNLVAAAGGVRRLFPLAGVLAVSVTGGGANDRLLMARALPVPATLDGGAGNDRLAGGLADDTLLGGRGNDRLAGRRGNDRLVGGGGNDKLAGGAGVNSLDGSQPAPAPQPPPDPQPAPQPPPAPPPLIQPPYPTSVVSRPVTLQRLDGTAFNVGRDVRAYRNSDGTLVAGDGVHDDTTGVQRAIDSLPRSQGLPQGNIAVGGTVFFPPGVYRTTQPLRVPGGVILAGAGPGSVIQYDGDGRFAVEFVNQGVDFCSGAGATDLTIRSGRGGGFGVRSAKRLHLTQMRFRDLVLDTAGWGIDLLGGDSSTLNSFFDNILVRSVGAGAVNVRGNANKLNAIRTEWAVRPGFNPAGGVVVADGGGNAFSNCVLAGLPGDAVGFNVRGGDGNGNAWFTNNSVVAPGGEVPAAGGAPAFVFEKLEGMYVDDLGGRAAKFTNVKGARIARQWTGGAPATLAQMLQADPQSRILIDDVYSTEDAGAPGADKAVFHVSRWHRGTAADYVAARGDGAGLLPPSPAEARQAVAIGLNAREVAGDDGSGARGDGSHDDTSSIQNAINAFLANRGNPNAPQSGAVYLPAGVYRLTAPLNLPSGVVLVGDGSGTAIRFTGSGAAVRFGDPSGTVTGAGLESLCISADNGGGVGDVRGVPVVNARMDDLVFNCSGWGIDLRDLRQSNVQNIHQKRLGAGSVRIDGQDNRVHAVNTEFGVRPGFAADPALVVVRGDRNTITGCVVEGVPSNSATAMYVSGAGVTFGNNWMEISSTGPLAAKDKVAVIFENLRDARINDFYLLNSNHRAKFINSQARLTMVDTNGEQWPLKTSVLADDATTLDVEFAISRHGLGDVAPQFRVAEQLVLFPGGDTTGGVWSARQVPAAP
jgi:Ca2+-binding RTX toxin-like protein